MAIAFDIGRSALLLIDLQRDLTDDAGFFNRRGARKADAAAVRELISNCQRLADEMRHAGRPVIVVKTEFRADYVDEALAPHWKAFGLTSETGALVAGSWGAELVDGLVVNGADYTVVKKGHSAFQHTNLDRVLTNFGADQIVLAGSNLLDGVNSTALMGVALGYDIFPIREALYPDSVEEIFRNPAEESISLADFPRVSAARQQSGQPHTPASALLIIDMQDDFIGQDNPNRRPATGDELEFRKTTEPIIIENNQKIAKAVRRRGWPVIFVKVSSRPDMVDSALSKAYTGVIEKGWLNDGPGLEVVHGLDVEESDILLEKKASSAFRFTPLHRMLRNLGVQHFYITGGAATGCVSKTTREGVGLGYGVTVVADALYPAESPHVDELLAKYADVRSTDSIVEELATQLQATA